MLHSEDTLWEKAGAFWGGEDMLAAPHNIKCLVKGSELGLLGGEAKIRFRLAFSCGGLDKGVGEGQ